MKNIGCGKYESTNAEAAVLPDPQEFINMQGSERSKPTKQEIKGIISPQQQTGYRQVNMRCSVCVADYLKLFSR